MKPIVLIFVLMVLFSCSRKTIPVRTIQNDSTRIEKFTEYIERIRIDTVLIDIPAQIALYSGNEKESFLETDFAESTARIDPNGFLFHDLKK
ncbi:MAG: hypothetical protein LIP01_02280 [Tannerellaceae bacterium]|nr:hypothetical protein [Tannerellaceae bacterium]